MDKKAEEKHLENNSKQIQQIDQAIDITEQIKAKENQQKLEEEVKAAEEAKKIANIPAPPADGLGNLSAPKGFGQAYCPDLRAGKVLPKERRGDQDS